jgi:hypothetical protein
MLRVVATKTPLRRPATRTIVTPNRAECWTTRAAGCK